MPNNLNEKPMWAVKVIENSGKEYIEKDMTNTNPLLFDDRNYAKRMAHQISDNCPHVEQTLTIPVNIVPAEEL